MAIDSSFPEVTAESPRNPFPFNCNFLTRQCLIKLNFSIWRNMHVKEKRGWYLKRVKLLDKRLCLFIRLHSRGGMYMYEPWLC